MLLSCLYNLTAPTALQLTSPKHCLPSLHSLYYNYLGVPMPPHACPLSFAEGDVGEQTCEWSNHGLQLQGCWGCSRAVGVLGMQGTCRGAGSAGELQCCWGCRGAARLLGLQGSCRGAGAALWPRQIYPRDFIALSTERQVDVVRFWHGPYYKAVSFTALIIMLYHLLPSVL